MYHSFPEKMIQEEIRVHTLLFHSKIGLEQLHIPLIQERVSHVEYPDLTEQYPLPHSIVP